ncbi:helix-turn-helix domain-containing protein [Paenibacillus sp. MER 99-2]|uniref:helix-turn-helix domain-containing protein n=1 Tax=Paenibacillus sp. MER 99-2 TaxID=2939572 RepID=UPI00203C072F|nr:helix-turn-helix domain-containing protein [Paenibacillus sp. MER 99-2]MCM3172879.1 helix-turn-helix domain-containing protein [Paenibacillus sp. MER 99-2]
MQHDLLETFDMLFDYIETHIQEKLSLDHLAAIAHISKFHLHRMFKHLSGQLPGEYIRARKLARSLEQLVDWNWKIIDISAHYAFEYEQSYIRAFKQAFGITPLQYRKQGAHDLRITARLTTAMITTLPHGYVLSPTYVRKPAMKLVGQQRSIRYIDNETYYEATTAGNNFMEEHFAMIPDAVHPGVYIGFTREMDNDHSIYQPSVEVHTFDHAPAGLDQIEVPASQYAVFKFICDFHSSRINIDHLDSVWTFIDEYWQSRSGYAKRDSYYFEWVDGHLAEENYGELDIYIPAQQILD